MEAARRVFGELDADGSGRLSAEEMAAALGEHLSSYEVEAALHQALLEAAGGEAAGGGGDDEAGALGGWVGASAAAPHARPCTTHLNPPSPPAAAATALDFDSFMALLRAPSAPISDELDRFTDRLAASRAASVRSEDHLPPGDAAPAATARDSSGGGGKKSGMLGRLRRAMGGGGG